MLDNIIVCTIVILIIILFTFVTWLLHWCLRFAYFEFYLRNIPGPRPIPLLGNVLELKDSMTVLPQLMKYHEKYKGSFKIYMRSQPYLYICEPKGVEFVLSSTKILAKTERHKLKHNWLGTGLLNSSGELWKQRSNIIAPAFHFRILEDFLEIFNAQGDILVSKLEKELNEDRVDIYPYVARCTLDIICESAMGTSMNVQENLDSEYVKNVAIVAGIITQRYMSPIFFNDTLFSYTPAYKREQEALEMIHGYSRSVINMRKDEFFGHVKKLEAIENLGIKKRRVFLDLLLEYASKNPSLTEEDVREEVDTFMVAGQATMSSSIAFTLYSLAVHHNIQEKVYSELKAIIGDDSKRVLIRKDLEQMTYLETVIMESLRMYPIIPIFGRKLEEDMKFEDKILPKGLMVNIFAYGIQNSKLFYKDPHIFNPERFSSENYSKMDPFTYVPFSIGPRICAGRKFALLELKSIISNLLRNFELLPTVPEHKLILKGDAVLRADNGVFIRIRKRTV